MRTATALAALTLTACTRPVSPAADPLAQQIAGRVAGPEQACVTQLLGENLRVIDSRTLAYGNGATIYVNRFPGPCPGLGTLSTVFVDAHGSQYCRGDRIRAREPGTVIAGPTCNLGNWVPYRRS